MVGPCLFYISTSATNANGEMIIAKDFVDFLGLEHHHNAATSSGTPNFGVRSDGLDAPVYMEEKEEDTCMLSIYLLWVCVQ